MIGKIFGKITEIHGNEGYIDTASGVSYKVYLTPNLAHISDKEITVYTYLNVREDELTLFGFETYELHKVFEYLIAVDGVGPKTAYTIVCTSQPDEIRKAAQGNDVAFFQKIKGIGKKTAQRILIDLSSRFGAEFDLEASESESQDEIDAIDALVSLGFKRKQAADALKSADPKASMEEKLKQALQSLGR